MKTIVNMRVEALVAGKKMKGTVCENNRIKLDGGGNARIVKNGTKRYFWEVEEKDVVSL
jgi:hypothetical protein